MNLCFLEDVMCNVCNCNFFISQLHLLHFINSYSARHLFLCEGSKYKNKIWKPKYY